VLSGREGAARWTGPAAWTGLAAASLVLLVVVALLVVRYEAAMLVVPLLILLTVIALTRPVFVVYVLAFTSPLTSGMARGLVVPFLRPNEMLLLPLIYAAMVTFLARKRSYRLTWGDGVLLLFLGFRVMLPTAVFLIRGEPWSFFAAKTLFGPLQYYVIYRMAVECVEDRRQVRQVIFLMLAASGIVSFVGILQALQVPGINAFLETWYPSNKEVYTFLFARRVTSLWAGDWNGVGVYLAMCTVLSLGTFHLFERRSRRVLVVILGVLDLLVVFLTASLTGTLALFLGLFVLLFQSPPAKRLVKPLLLLSPLVGFILATVFWSILSERLQIQFGHAATSLIPSSFRIRIHMWRELMWPWVERYWLWGLGPYRWGWPTEESYYMLLILKGGILALLSYFALLGVMLFRLRRYFAWIRQWQGAVSLVLWIQLLQVFISNISGSHFESNGVAEIMFLLFGFLMAAEVRGRGLAWLREGDRRGLGPGADAFGGGGDPRHP
jgi:hypothetical protein